MKITRRAANVHTIDCEGKEAEFLLISDLHWEDFHLDEHVSILLAAINR